MISESATRLIFTVLWLRRNWKWLVPLLLAGVVAGALL